MSNDLISRSALMQSLRNNVLVDVTPNLEQAIAEQPIAYDVDKVVEQLGQKEEDAKKYWQEFDDEDAFGEMNAYRNAIQIVKSGGIE